MPHEGEGGGVRRTFLKLHQLNEGISYFNITSAYYAALLSICFFVFMDASQAFVLTTYLGYPKDKQASAIGDLAFYGEIVILATTNMWGTISDKFGRRVVYVSGFLIIAIGFGLYPFARSLPVLFLFRMIFALGASACASMLTAVLADYVYINDRGTGSGLLGLAAGGGAVLGALVLLQVPNWLDTTGLGNYAAGYITYIGIAAVAIVSGIILLFGLRVPTVAGRHKIHHSYFKMLKEGLLAARNPVLSLAYASGFAARGDSAVASTFLSFWVFQAAHASGMSDTKALARAGVVSGIAQTCALVFAPIAGVLCSKLHRVIAMALLSALAGFGYILICFTDDPLGAWMMIGACTVGCGEIGLVVSSTALVAQEAPPPIRGSVSGVFSFCGAIGIILATKIGGTLSGDGHYSAPFMMFGAFNMALLVFSIAVYIYIRVFPQAINNNIDDQYEALTYESTVINDPRLSEQSANVNTAQT